MSASIASLVRIVDRPGASGAGTTRTRPASTSDTQRPQRHSSPSRRAALRRLEQRAQVATEVRRPDAAAGASTASSGVVTPVSTSRLSRPGVDRALDVGVEAVAHDQRAGRAGPATASSNSGRSRLAGDHERLAADVVGQRGDERAVARVRGREAVGTVRSRLDATHGTPVASA